MSTLLDRLVGAFYVAGAEAEPPVAPTRPRAAEAECRDAAALRRTGLLPAIAVLAQARDVAVAGGAVGLAAARECRAAVAVVCTWSGAEEPARAASAPATAAAHRLAETLRRRGHSARASRRLVFVALPVDDAAAAREAARVDAAAGTAPVVLALGGPRGPHLEAALGDRGLVVVAGPSDGDAALAALALAGLEAVGVRAVACEVPVSSAARALAAAGVGASSGAWPGLRSAIAELR